MKINQPFLMFSMPLDNTPELNRGRLVLYDWEQGHLGRWVATTGLGQFQKIGGWSKQGGGVCPAPYQCNPKFANYWVAVEPVNLSHVKGVEGSGYPITPFAVRTKEGIERSDLLIHRDANVPGSMGCIVLADDEYSDFEKQFSEFCKGHQKVKLWVQYDF
jgi:hypothetical protein